MKTFDKIKTGAACLYLVWLLVVVILFFCGKCSFWTAFSPIWVPAVAIAIVMYLLLLLAFVGDHVKIIRDKKNPPCCENCLWAKARKVAGSCIGESNGALFGTICDKYCKDTSK